MKVLKCELFGSPTLGVSCVKITQSRNGRLEVKQSQGTSYKAFDAKDMAHANEMYEGLCSQEEQKYGKYDKSKWEKQ